MKAAAALALLALCACSRKPEQHAAAPKAAPAPDAGPPQLSTAGVDLSWLVPIAPVSVSTVSGRFFAALGDTVSVLLACFSVAVAGALSMAAGAYIATGSEAEVRETETARRRFLGEPADDVTVRESPLGSAVAVGVSYFAGAVIPVLPVLFGARGMWPTMVTAGTTIILVSSLVAFLSGMDVRRRMGINLVIIALAVGVTYAIGMAARTLFTRSPSSRAAR